MSGCKKRGFVVVFAVFCCFAVIVDDPVLAARRPRASIRERQRVDLRDLGYPLVNEVPANSSAITSLITARDGKIYGATSGEQAYLFVFNPVINKVRHLGRIADQAGVHHSLVEDKDGCIYIGTGKNVLDEIELSKWGPRPEQEDLIDWDNIEELFKENYVDHVLYEMKLSGGNIGYQYVDLILWNDIRNYFRDYAGGHLYRYNPRKSNAIVKLVDMDCEVEDLGIPVPNNSIYALTISPQGDVVYGLTYPDGHFFIYDTGSRQFRDMGEIDNEITFHGPERYWRSLPRALVCDDAGRVYTSGTNGILKYYCPKSGKIISTDLVIPSDDYLAHPYIDYAVVEYFARADSGLIYGGTSDGYLFSFDPENNELVNLGKPRAARRLRCLTVAKNGEVYMMAGERVPSKPCQLYVYAPQTGGFENLGILSVDRSPYYLHRGFQFDSMTTGEDGTVFFGESDRRSHLFVYIP